MIPDAPTVLGGIARSMMMDLAPEVTSAYGQQTIQLGSGLLMMIAQEFDRAAARLAEENAAIVAVFRAAAPVITDAELRAELQRQTQPLQVALQVSALQARNRELRTLLTRLHAHVESLATPAAGAVDEQIWQELVASVARRHLDLANG